MREPIKGTTPSSAERHSDNPVGEVIKATPAEREAAKRRFAELQAMERQAISSNE